MLPEAWCLPWERPESVCYDSSRMGLGAAVSELLWQAGRRLSDSRQKKSVTWGGLVHLRCVHFDSVYQQVLFWLGIIFWILLVQESATFFLKEHSKYFQLFGPFHLCPDYSAVTICPQMGIAVPRSNFIYQNRPPANLAFLLDKITHITKYNMCAMFQLCHTISIVLK